MVDGAVGEGDGEFTSSGVEFELPSAFVDEVMVSATAGDEAVEVRLALLGSPFVEMVDLAVVERDVAVADTAAAVHRP